MLIRVLLNTSEINILLYFLFSNKDEKNLFLQMLESSQA